jgi:hypothetical protein
MAGIRPKFNDGAGDTTAQNKRVREVDVGVASNACIVGLDGNRFILGAALFQSHITSDRQGTDLDEELISGELIYGGLFDLQIGLGGGRPGGKIG